MPTPIWSFPEAIDLEKIEQITAPLLTEAQSPFLAEFPDENRDDTVVRWVQEDNYTGLQQVRGYGGKPQLVQRTGDQMFMATPGVYGEHMVLEEEELTRRRARATWGTRVSVDDMVAECQRRLLVRRLQLKNYIITKFVLEGTYTIQNKAGTVVKSDSFTPQVFTPTVAWSDHANSTPINDIRTAALIPFGQSVDMGPAAQLWVNQLLWNNLIQNKNPNDLGGLRLAGLSPIQDRVDLNKYLGGQGLPQIGVYDGFYVADNGTRKGQPLRYIGNAQGVLFGKRASGAKTGSYQFTCNINSPNAAPKPYTRVIDRGTWEVPASIEVHDGHNGGPTIKYPGAFVTFNGLM